MQVANLVKLNRDYNIPSKRKSSPYIDYIPAVCTHRLSLLPIKWLSEIFGLECLTGLEWLQII